MNKKYCDICGKEMCVAGNKIKIEPNRDHCFGISFQSFLDYNDVCDGCKNQILTMINSLSDKNKKKINLRFYMEDIMKIIKECSLERNERLSKPKVMECLVCDSLFEYIGWDIFSCGEPSKFFIICPVCRRYIYI